MPGASPTRRGSSRNEQVGLRRLRRALRHHVGRRARPPRAPPAARRHLLPPDARACGPDPVPTTAATRWSTTATSNRHSAERADLEKLGRRPARSGHQPVPRRGHQPHRPRAPVGAGCTRRLVAAPRLLPGLRRPHAARPVRGDAARGVPGDGPGQLHLRRRALGVGVDHVPHLPMGPQLRQPRCVRRDARRHARPGQPRCRRVASRRRGLHLEADGHELPEPARGPPDRPGLPGVRRHGCAGRDPEGRGDRRPRSSCVPYLGAHRNVRREVPPGVPQPADGDAVELPGHQGRDAGRRVVVGAAGDAASTPDGCRTCAATTTSAGPSTTLPRARGLDGAAHRRFLAEFYRGDVSPARSPKGGRSRRTRWPTTSAPAGRRRHCAGSMPRCDPATGRQPSWLFAGCCSATAWSLPSPGSR